MKRALSLVLCAFLVLSLASCGKKGPERSYTLPNEDGKTVICIDPGHGFRDIGCESEYMDGYEKDLALKISLVMKEVFESHGASVYLTHDGENFPTVAKITSDADRLGIPYDAADMEENDLFGKYERAIWENVLDREYSLDMFISVHVNYIENPDMRGATVDFCTENPYADMLSFFSERLSEHLLTSGVSADFRIYPDAPEEAYVVNKYVTCPSVLIEAGYSTNRDDARDMQDEGWQRSFSEEVWNALSDTLS